RHGLVGGLLVGNGERGVGDVVGGRRGRLLGAVDAVVDRGPDGADGRDVAGDEVAAVRGGVRRGELLERDLLERAAEDLEGGEGAGAFEVLPGFLEGSLVAGLVVAPEVALELLGERAGGFGYE